MTTVAVNFMTYSPEAGHPRAEYAKRCLDRLLQNLEFPEGAMIWHIADDGSFPGHVESLIQICHEYAVSPTTSNSEHRGYGANMNMATQIIHPLADIVIPVEEDWELVRPFDISGLVRTLNESPKDWADPDYIACIRLGYLGFTNRVNGWLTWGARQMYFRLDPESIENHVFAGHPRIETVEYEKRVGPWPEGLRPGYTEQEIAIRRESRFGVAWPMDAGINASQDYANLFAHIGEVQGG